MNAETGRWLLLSMGAVSGYALTMQTNPVRGSLREGLRCLARYQRLWLIPAGFSLAHAAFILWVRVYEAWVLPQAPTVFLPWMEWQPPSWPDVALNSLLPTAENTTALFNCLVTTFPISAFVAVLFLINWRGYTAVLYRRLCQRFGQIIGTGIESFLLLCALAALCKPLLFGGLLRLNGYLGEVALLRAAELTNTLSFFFEYLLGVGVQIYLVLLAFVWIRGLTFDFPRLRQFALRRFSSVFRWAAIVLAISASGINVPLLFSRFQSGDSSADAAGFILVTRWILVATLLIFCSIQILLIFHDASLRDVLMDACQLWRQQGWHVGWMIVTATMHYYILAVANAFLRVALGPWTWPAATWTLLVYPLLWSVLSGWLLASWVCLHRRCEQNCPMDAESVRF